MIRTHFSRLAMVLTVVVGMFQAELCLASDKVVSFKDVTLLGALALEEDSVEEVEVLGEVHPGAAGQGFLALDGS